MTFQQIVRVLWQRAWVMVLLATLTAAAAFGFSRIVEQRAPLYTSTIHILVQPARTESNQAQAAQQLLGVYQGWLLSGYRAATVIDHLGLDMTPQELLEDVEVTTNLNQLTLDIEVESPDPRLASRVAWEWATVFVQWRNGENSQVQQEERIDAFILDDPVVRLARPTTLANVVTGGILGFLVGMPAALALTHLEAGTLRSREDVERSLAIPVLSTIPPADR